MIKFKNIINLNEQKHLTLIFLLFIATMKEAKKIDMNNSNEEAALKME